MDPEALQRIQGDFNIRLRNQFANNVDGHAPAQQRQRQQQCGQILARNVAAHTDSVTAVCRAGLDMQRRITLNAVVIDLRTQTAQGINEIADRPLVHTGHARQTIIAAAKCQRRRQRTKGSTGIAEKQFGALDCKRPARPAHAQNTARLIRDINPQQTQCVEHAARVVGIQHVVNEGVSPRQCSQQQNAVGNAFRTRQL